MIATGGGERGQTRPHRRRGLRSRHSALVPRRRGGDAGRRRPRRRVAAGRAAAAGRRPRRAPAPRGRRRTAAVPGGRPEPWDWHRFREVAGLAIDNKVRSDGRRATSGRRPGSAGRRSTIAGSTCSRDVAATDVEMSAEFLTTTGEAQCGFALRVQPDRAVVVWRNIYYAATANMIHGVWEYDGATLLQHEPEAPRTAGLRAAGPLRGRRRDDGHGHDHPAPPARPHATSSLHEGGMSRPRQVIVATAPGPVDLHVRLAARSACGGRGRGRTGGTMQARRRAAVRLVGTR